MHDRHLPKRIVAGWNESDQSRDAVALAEDLAELFGGRFALAQVHHGDPGTGLRELVAERDGDLLVLGVTHRGTLGRLLPGSVAERLLAEPPCPIAIAPEGYARRRPHLGFGIVGVGYDGTHGAREALEFARELAGAAEGELRIVDVAPEYVESSLPLGPFEPLRREPYARVERALESAEDSVPTSGIVVTGKAAAALEDQSVELDLLVVGSHGRGPIGDRLLGSVSADVIRKASCPVIVVGAQGLTARARD